MAATQKTAKKTPAPELFGPTRGELWFRIAFSLFGLALMLVALVYRGISGPAWVEIVLFGGAFFGGTVIHSAIRLRRG